MPSPFLCYLRVYEPLSALSGTYGARVRAGLARGALAADQVPERDRQLCLRAALATPPRLLPGERDDGTVQADTPLDVLVLDGRLANAEPLVCPLDTRSRAAAALVGFLTTASPVVRAAALPMAEPAVRQRARAAMAEVPGATHVVSSTWTVPLPWFALFDQAERTLRLTDEGPRRVWWRTTLAQARDRLAASVRVLESTLGEQGPMALLRDTVEWLEHFADGSVVELDYGGLVQLVNDEWLIEDSSAADVADAMDGLEAGDAERVSAAYERLRLRWASLAVHERFC